MKILIDGYNLIRRTALADLEQIGLDKAREELAQRLTHYQRRKGHKVIVVFDGPSRSRSQLKGIEVVFDRPADRALKNMASPGMMVVTSDADVRREAEAKGATSCPSEEFWRRLQAESDRPLGGDVWFKPGDDLEEVDVTTPKKGNPRRLPREARKRNAKLDKL